MSAPGQRVAVVAPFFGADLRGRKERFTYAYVTHLALEGVAVEVITTAARPDAADHNAYRSGLDKTEPFPIHRFPIVAPDRAAYAEALLAVQRDADALWSRERTLLDERLRSPELIGHLRVVAAAYDAFLFFDATAWTTVRGIAEVAETALLAPLLDDDPIARLPAVVQAVGDARLILCTSEAEAALVADAFGPQARRRTRIVGLAADVVPRAALDAERLQRLARRPYLLTVGEDPAVLAALRETGVDLIRLESADDRDRAALFAGARAVVLTDERLRVVPELIEAWGYGTFALVSAGSPGAAAAVRETGAGLVVPDRDAWADAVRGLPPAAVLAERAAGAASYVAQGNWPRVAQRTSEAIDEMATMDDGRPRAALRAQIAYLYPLVQRQRRVIEAMRVSRFWRLRDAWFAVRRRIGIASAGDPIPLPTSADRAVELAALGDPYQLFLEQHRLRREDGERLRAMLPFLRPVRFGLVVDVRRRGLDGLRTALRSLREQVYGAWSARIVVDAELAEAQRAELSALAGEDARFVVVAPGGDPFGEADFIGPLDPGDRLEPHALFEFALALQDDGADVVYSDEDRLDEQGIPRQPWFKPDWSPETLLTRDYVGRLCLLRRTVVEAVGGVRDVVESARWYDALLRVSERTERVRHVAQVLYHRSGTNAAAAEDLALAAEVALSRRGEAAEVALVPAGAEVRFAVPGDERVTIVIPTRDRPELLAACLESLFGRTTYRAFDVVVIDNGSRLAETRALLADWGRREPGRFRVLADPSPFNYSALNNRAIATTDAPYVVLLNNDTEVVAPGWLEAMLGQARRAPIGAVGALLLYDDDTVQHAGVVVGILGLAGHAHRYFPAASAGYHGGLRLDTNYLAVTGACLMVARAKFLEVGGLDEGLAVSSNDVDFCLKLYAAGYRNVVVPRAVLRHKESKTRGGDDTPAKVRRTMHEIALFRARWPELSARDPYYNPNLTVEAEDFGVQL